MQLIRAVLPIDPEMIRWARADPKLSQLIEYCGGLPSLAEYALECRDDQTLFDYGLREALYNSADFDDVDPRQHRSALQHWLEYYYTSRTQLYLEMFFDTHVENYTRVIGEDLLRTHDLDFIYEHPRKTNIVIELSPYR